MTKIFRWLVNHPNWVCIALSTVAMAVAAVFYPGRFAENVSELSAYMFIAGVVVSSVCTVFYRKGVLQWDNQFLMSTVKVGGFWGALPIGLLFITSPLGELACALGEFPEIVVPVGLFIIIYTWHMQKISWDKIKK